MSHRKRKQTSREESKEPGRKIKYGDVALRYNLYRKVRMIPSVWGDVLPFLPPSNWMIYEQFYQEWSGVNWISLLLFACYPKGETKRFH